MKMNSAASLKTGQRLLATHGSWNVVREKSRVAKDGVFVVKITRDEALQAIKKLEKA